MGSYLTTPKTEKVSEDRENDSLRYCLSSMQGWRATMEDAHAAHLELDSSTSFFGVYDGHSGEDVAKFCAKYLHQQVLEHESYLAGDLGTSLQRALLRMDELICGESGQRELARLRGKIEQDGSTKEDSVELPTFDEANGSHNDYSSDEGDNQLLEANSALRRPSSGSTACVAVIRNNQLVVANVGDSRCVISRKGQAYNLSRDHKPDLVDEKDRILKAGGYVQMGRINGSLNLARAIGDMEFKQNKSLPAEKQIVTADPEINKVELCDEDEFLVIACDGIWDCMSSQELVDYVHKQLNPGVKLSAVCERVFDQIISPLVGGKGCDNMTMILVQFKKPFGRSASDLDQPLFSYPDVYSDSSSDDSSEEDTE